MDGGYLVYWLDWPITATLDRAGVLEGMSSSLWIGIYGIFGALMYAAPGAVFGSVLDRIRMRH